MRLRSILLEIIAVIVVSTLLAGCSAKTMSKDELSSYLHDESNGLLKKIRSKDVLLELVYRPNDLIVAQEIDEMDYTSGQIDSIKNRYQEYVYFILKLSRNGQEITNSFASDPQQFNRAIEYLSFEIGRDFQLVNETEKLAVEDFMHTRSFGASNANTVLLAFKSNLVSRSQDFSLLFEDTFFRTGMHQFDFEIDDLKSIPQLDFTLSNL